MHSLICRYGADKINVGEFLSIICTLTSDGAIQVRSAAMDTLVEMYRAIGSKLYSLIHKCRISPVRMKTLTEKLKNLESAEKKYQVSFGILITLINFLCKMGKTFAVCVFMCVCSEVF